MSSSMEELYQKLLSAGISEEQLEQELERKVKEFGGFMTKQGILFIIAKEHGITLYNKAFYKELDEMIDYDEFSIPVAEVKEQMTNIVLVGKIISVSKLREFVRKDSSVGKVGSFVLGDWTGTIKVVLWEDTAEIVDQNQFREGEIVRVIGGYSKIGSNNSLEVHLGKKGRVIVAPQDISKEIVKQLANIHEVMPNKNSIIPQYTIKELIAQYSFIKKLQGEVHIEEFKELTKKSGDKTFLLKLLVSDSSTTIPLSIWGMQAVESLKLLEEGCTILVTNLSLKENAYTRQKELQFTNKSNLRVL